jgi:hypothetical protein
MTASRPAVGDTASLLLQLLSWLLRFEPQAPAPTAATEELAPSTAAARLSLAAAAGPAVAEAPVLASPELEPSAAGAASAEASGACAAAAVAFSPLLPRLNRSLLAARVPAALLLPPALTLYFLEAGRAKSPAVRPGNVLPTAASPAGASTKAGSGRTIASGSGELIGNMNWLLETCR